MITNRFLGLTAVLGLCAALLPLNCGGKTDGSADASESGGTSATATTAESGGTSATATTAESGGTSATATTAITIGPVDVETWATAMAQAVCARADRCHGIAGSGIDSYQVVREMPCLDYFTAFFGESYSPSEAIDAGRLSAWDADAFGACLEKYAMAACEADERLSEVQQWPCLRIFGAVPIDGSCETQSECISGYCDVSSGCPGTCRDKSEGSCDSDYACGVNSYCDGICDSDSVDGTCCMSHSGEGEDCDPYSYDGSFVCAPGLDCTDNSDAAGGWSYICTPSSFMDIGRSCANTNCETGLVCTTLDSTSELRYCAATMELGGVCFRDDSALGSICTDGTFCNAATNQTTGTCAPRAAVGEDCDASNPRNCVLGATCDQTTLQCRAITFGTVGEPCATDADCFGYCKILDGVGTCALQPC